MDQNRVDPAYAEELFLWILEKPDDDDKLREEKLRDLAIAFDTDPRAVLNAVDAVANKASLYPPTFDFIVPKDAVPTWRNCIDEQPCVPLEYSYPASLSDLVGIVADAVKKKAPVRAVGSGHSFSDITNSQDAILVDPSKSLKQVFPVDPSILYAGTDPANAIRAQCGITVAAFNRVLDARSLGLINMGAYDGQTISGALSTGTHGSGKNYGPMSDFLLSIVLVTENGKVYQIEPSPDSAPITDPAKFAGHLPEAPDIAVELKQDNAWFNAAKVAMGCLGLIYSYTIRVQPAFSISEVRTMTTWEDVKPLLSSWPPPILDNTDHFELLINPYDEGEHHKCVKVERMRKALTKPSGARLTKLWQWLEEQSVSHSQALVALLNTAHSLWFTRSTIDTALGFLPDMEPPYIDISHNVLTLGVENTVKAWALELHFNAADDCVGTIDKVLEAFKSIGNDKQWFIAGPLGIRFVKSSDAFIAPQAGRFTCTVECDMLYGINNAKALLGEVKKRICDQSTLTGSDSIRIHWGLDWGYTTADDVRKWYPDFGKWQAVYRELNTTGMFDNVFTKRLRVRE
ncbi:FAD-binding domain-containing protein [Coniochaeta ligniaria NRRL 30616]|uniref:D-arabinono-1,4-lactone oxidase n=1 Tax=Coniochaeta ligniaria NRRL 30616 TaxID=1408157 RepID=A0A1J7I7W7_9PEZI|nr:FAD-binding domain-containing protein [Coniochaeta ligniaria NRRL 30616]